MNSSFTNFWYGVCVATLIFGAMLTLKDNGFNKKQSQIVIESEVARKLSSISDYMILIIRTTDDSNLSEDVKIDRIAAISIKINEDFTSLSESYQKYYELSGDKQFLATSYKNMASKWDALSNRISN